MDVASHITPPRTRRSAVARPLLPLLAALALSAACATAPAGQLDRSGLAKLARERGVDPEGLILPYELTDEMKAWVRAAVPEGGAPEARLKLLLQALVDPERLNLIYESHATGTAAEVFATRRANCLAFTNLYVGAAREIGVPVVYLDVNDLEKFEKEGDLIVVSGHISAGYDSGTAMMILDFSPEPRADYREVQPISDVTAVALYYSNRGAELLRASQHEEALPWLRTAVALDPELARGWINLGVALRRNGDVAGAEQAYRKALECDPQAVSAYQNLASLLRLRGRDQEALELMALSERLGSRNPYNYLNLGDLSLAYGRLDEARRFYRKALRLYRQNPEPYAAMGLWSLAAGDPADALRWLKKAVALDQENERVKLLEARLGNKRS